MKVPIDLNSTEDYRLFLKIKSLPSFRFRGRIAEFPDEYARLITGDNSRRKADSYSPMDGLFDYQAAISKWAIRKHKAAIFADCGLGKTLMILEYVRHVRRALGSRRKVLIVSPLMVVRQTLAECLKWYGKQIPIKRIAAADLQEFLDTPENVVGITNYEALTPELQPGNLGCLVLDESSMLKSHYGAWGRECIRLGAGLDWKLCATGTPAPNDRIEYANHAVFLDAFPTVNAFLARFFVNRGQTNERWELKPHALAPFYRAISHWCVFLTNPATYGWKDNAGTLPPINVNIHHVELTEEQSAIVQEKTRSLFHIETGGITSRSTLGQIGKGSFQGRTIETLKPAFIRALVDSFPGESTLIWCLYNREQELMEQTFPEAASLKGDTPIEQREKAIAEFKAGTQRILISKPKILGFGLNLQIATRQVFSGLQDSYETYYQCVKRSNRVGSDKPLNVHIPVTEIESPMVETVLRKAHRVQLDTEEQERIFKEYGLCAF